MSGLLTEDEVRLLGEAQLAHVATIDADGMPHITVVWVETDGEHLRFNTSTSRAKYRNLRRLPRAAISVVDRDRPLRFVSVQGTVTMTEEGAGEHIQRLSQRYLGRPYPLPLAGDVRVICTLTPTRVLRFTPVRR